MEQRQRQVAYLAENPDKDAWDYRFESTASAWAARSSTERRRTADQEWMLKVMAASHRALVKRLHPDVGSDEADASSWGYTAQIDGRQVRKFAAAWSKDDAPPKPRNCPPWLTRATSS